MEAENDEELVRKAREHVNLDHPEMGLGDEEVRGIVESGAYEK